MDQRKTATGSNFCALSLFSGGGIGDISIDWGERIPVIAKCELLRDRASLLRHNYPKSEVFEGDIWDLQDDIVKHVQMTLGSEHPWLVVASPPCQGMSSNGAGRISNAIKKGRRSPQDERNRLILPSISIIEKLMPDWFIFENVPNMQNTVILNEIGQPENIMQTLQRRLGRQYTIKSCVLDFADYGVPQYRKRLITIGCSIKKIRDADPEPGILYSNSISYLHPVVKLEGRVSLRDAIGQVEPLDAKEKTESTIEPLHRVPEMNEDHYHWISNTPEGETAFDNFKCSSCEYLNEAPEDKRARDLLVNCKMCYEILPRPTVNTEGWICATCELFSATKNDYCENGHPRNDALDIELTRIIRGFSTSYRRMKWDEPAKTITQNSGVFSSDGKGHPEQNRVLSLHEILLLQTVHSNSKFSVPWNGMYEFRFRDETGKEYIPKKKMDYIIRNVIGESIPPFGFQKVVSRLIELTPFTENGEN